jgi:hypothetical protein
MKALLVVMVLLMLAIDFWATWPALLTGALVALLQDRRV